MDRIDFVIPWVDGNDPQWQAAFQKVVPSEDMDARMIRYRDWDLLRYWFRGVEQFAPWVHRIYFVTWGHLPDWLNSKHSQLRIVNHRDFIPGAYLPTFNINAIELNLHRIPGLGEQFVYFNDDVFLLRPSWPQDFFRKGLPCDSALMNPLYTLDLADAGENGRIHYFAMNDVQELNRFFTARDTIRRHPWKWFYPGYGSHLLRNLMLSAWPRFVGFVDHHLAQPYLKSSFEAAWRDSSRLLEATCRRPIRSDHDLNQWYIRYRQLAGDQFVPRKPLRKGEFTIGRESERIAEMIRHQRLPMICLNDGVMEEEKFQEEQSGLKSAFEQIFPRRSSFELFPPQGDSA